MKLKIWKNKFLLSLCLLIVFSLTGCSHALKTNDKISLNNGEKVVSVVKQVDKDNYLVFDIKPINITYGFEETETCYFQGENDFDFSGCDNTYSKSNVDKYLNTVYYESLSDEIQNAIKERNISQSFYAHLKAENNCYEQNNGTNLSNKGSHPYPNDWENRENYQTWSDGKIENIDRKVYLLSLEELNMLVNLSSFNDVQNFLDKLEIDSERKEDVMLLTRDANTLDASSVMMLNYYTGSPVVGFLTNNNSYAIAAYVIDLSNIDYERID